MNRPTLSLPQPTKTLAPIIVGGEETMTEIEIAPTEEELQAAFAAHREALAAWEAERLSEESKLPRHPMAGPWLAAHPTPGVEAIDRGDGLGPRLLGWAGDHPDIDSWAATYVAPPTREAELAAKLAALSTAKDNLDKASTVAGVRAAAAAAIAALEARVAALEGR